MTARPAELAVTLYGTRLATLVDRARDGVSLRWEADGLRRWPINSTVMSVLLPLTPSAAPKSARVRVFFAGLLPEGDARVHLAVDAGVDPDDVMGMLAVYGRDVAGALVICPEGGGPEAAAPELAPIDDAEIRVRLERADSNDAPLGVVPGVTSLSLAGMQPKIALHRTVDGQWRECRGGAPSTHIVKPGRPSTRTADLIHNEAYCLRLARRVDITTVDASVEDFDGHAALVVSRYDRRREGTAVERIHQEDAAQMLGLATEDPIRKFQYGRPMPSLARIAAVLDREYAPRLPLLALTTFNIAVGNTDAHAKNISVLHRPDGSLELAPAYDVSPHRHYPFSGRRAAMAVNGVDDIDALTAEDLVAEGVGWGLRHEAATTAVNETLERLRDALADDESAERTGVAPAARSSMTDRVGALLAGRPAGSTP
ncbi:MAG: HipA domain-containing protein [Kineosporiaceae bacterium]